ncbi:beta-ketoacyl synthase [Actinomadura sp. NAK00032]|uniref:beta-ketoacyl synthase N-terminal-like domain-containing protein n=1 Tax=Actinomadura sp. NAK00032 TaxID=2742128 RepID=UPI001591CF9A|nr:beta-ketoacyl synthase N-terminal-like domain-containing protein [Actinomadura sp. NAK00032]QKW37595.1 beta-ketoacyl synthase [Actinomadura sp. NAK00032]
MEAAEIRTLMEEQLALSRRLRARIRALEDERRAPLAVVGMGLRLPGGLRTPGQYWDFLRGEGTALTAIPEDRPGLREVHDPVVGRPGRSYVDRAGFVDDIAAFDADFFGISHREAKLLDPQQRMLLEVAWEAMERAGIPVRRSDRLDVGVYLGMMASEYLERLEDRSDTTRIDPYYTTGGGLCFAAGRISHVMGFSGPVVSADTACSSSMTALHLAVRALRGRECRYALVCGSNLILSANLMVSLCQTRALSPEGRSKSFLAAADGYGRGEGVGALVLMRLDEAEREGRPVLAVVRGTAVNHDGAASSLTAPNGPAQEEVIGAALKDAGVEAADIGWIEAHGTGTPLGDPIEVGALDGALGAAVRERGVPLALGSVKSRLGHLEAASGIAALIKTVLVLQHGVMPAARDEDDGELNPRIPWDRIGFTVPARNHPWPSGLRRRVAGVNSFGMSGTNVHAVLEAYTPAGRGADEPAGASSRPELLTLSAKSPQALAELADDVVSQLKSADPAALGSLCHTLRAGRAGFPYRVAVTGTTATELAERLAAAAGGPAAREPAAPVRSLTLRGELDSAAIAAGTAALAGAFPAMFPAGSEQDPAGERLARAIGRFGLPLRPRPAGGASGVRPGASLEWATDGALRSCPLIGDDPADAERLLLEALATLYTDGADLRLEPVRAPGARTLPDLPTYPFRRTRFWIGEPPMGAGAGARGNGTAAHGGAEGTVKAPPPGDGDGVRAFLMARLKDVLQSPEDLDPEASLQEAGADSFITTLFITKVEEHYDLGLPPEDLHIEIPLAELIAMLADTIAATAADRTERSA